MKSRLEGDRRLRRLLNRMEPEMRRPVTRSVEAVGRRVQKDAIAFAIGQGVFDETNTTDHMVDHIDYKTYAKGLGVIVGPGAKSAFVRKSAFSNLAIRLDRYKRLTTKIRHMDDQWAFMKGYWAEVTVPEHVKKPQRPFMKPAYEENRAQIRRVFQLAIRKALRSAAR